MLSEEEWRATDYFENFHCKGGACRNSCCEGWEIAIGMKDYFNLVGLECPEEIHHHIECAFRVPEEVSPERYRMISPNWLGQCPLHDADGLCMIHRHCGEEHLPEICRVYPRSMKRESGELRACCSGSCEAVAEELMREEPLRIVSRSLDLQPEYSETEAPDFPERSQHCLDLLQNRAKPLRKRLAEICAYIIERNVSLPQDCSEGALQSLMGALETLTEESVSLQRFGQAAFERYRGENALKNYRADAEKMEAAFPHWQEWFENLLANHFFYACVPCVDPRLREEQAVPGICLLYGTMRGVCAAYLTEHSTKDDFADALAGVMRLAEHSAFYYNARILLSDPLVLLGM